jgi:Rrf2 family iron-sulfur cluster assembly transcriptional regulator
MFSSLTRNAVDTLLWVCKNQVHGPVTTDSISKRLGLSISYLESLLSRLKKLGFLISYRGPGGGYCTNGKPEDLKLITLVQALDFNQPGKSSGAAVSLCFIDKDLVNWLMQDHLSQSLQHMSFADIMDMVSEDTWGAAMPKSVNQIEPRKFKPLQIHKLPSGPNSVFNLAASMSL